MLKIVCVLLSATLFLGADAFGGTPTKTTGKAIKAMALFFDISLISSTCSNNNRFLALLKRGGGPQASGSVDIFTAVAYYMGSRIIGLRASST